MATYVLVHGAWHSGDLFEGLANLIRAEGHKVHTPTLAGNRPGDSKRTGLDEAINSLTDYFIENGITDAVLVGHSYGGMVITGAADRLPEGTIRRLVYWSAYVPNNGESLEDISPKFVRDMHDSIQRDDGSILITFEGFREFLLNDADIETARHWHAKLNPHPRKTMQDKIRLTRNPAEMPIGKSYLHCQEDVCVPQSAGGWHPQFSEKLGFFRFLSMPGSHDVCFSNPELLARKIIMAGRD